MKKNLFIIISALMMLLLASCDTEPEAIDFHDPLVNPDGLLRDEAYYQNLRDYKKTMHERPLLFGWFGNWSGDDQASKRSALSGLPDSVDMVSIWQSRKLIFAQRTEAQTKDLKYAQEVLGIKVLFSEFSHNWNFWFIPGPQGVDSIPANDSTIRAYAKSMLDSMEMYGYDGIDLDHECSRGDIFYDKHNMSTLISELGKRIGPMSGTDKILTIDGHLSYIVDTCWKYVNYGISQAYASISDSRLQTRYNEVKNALPPHKFIVTENFESLQTTGGVEYTDKDGKRMRSAEGQARWNPEEGLKGGSGFYHIEFDYNGYPAYKHVRKSIQIQNPAFDL